MDVLHPLSAGLIRGIHIDGRHQFTESIRGEFFNMNVLVRFLDELFNILDLLFLYFNFLLDGENFLFQLLLFGIVALTHHVEAVIAKIEQYADLVSRIEEMAAESGQAADALKDAEKRLADMAVLIKNVSTYQKTKPVYDAYRKARNREKYRAGQEQAIILHEAAARSLKAAGIAKLPNLAALQSEYEALQAQKEALYADYGKLKKKVREYDIIKQNIDSILQADRQPEREKGTERG